MKNIFYAEESASHPGYYFIRWTQNKFYTTSTEGSFAVMPARLMNLGYADYLRLCRDIFGAMLIGKGTMYPVPLFKKTDVLNRLIKMLNVCATQVIFEREHPDYEEHKQVVQEYETKISRGAVYGSNF